MSQENSPPIDEMAAEKGLPMAPRWNPEQLAKEKAELQELAAQPLPSRAWGYVKRSGPGIMQSAMTLGAGSATASVIAGSLLGYKLLWVQPLAMFLGVMMLGALGNVVLTTRERPYKAFAKEMGIAIIFLWGLGTIIASIVWHFPQYTLAAGAVRDLVSLSGLSMSVGEGETGVLFTSFTSAGFWVGVITGITILAINITVVFGYGSGGKGVKIYEWFARIVIAMVILMFTVVFFASAFSGKIDWMELFKGFTGYYGIPRTGDSAVDARIITQVLGMLGAAVGINMTFLYPYTLLAKGWGHEHKSLARWDLGLTMLLPFSIVTSLIIIACAVGVNGDPKYDLYQGAGTVAFSIKPLDAAKSLTGVVAEGPARIVFCVGLIGMTLTAISAHMLVCGFTVCEMLGLKLTKKRFRLFALTPCIGVLGVVFSTPFWVPVVASAICLTMLPIAYFIFLVMNNRRSYIGEAVGKGPVRWLVNAILLVALCFTCLATCIKLKSDVIDKVLSWFN